MTFEQYWGIMAKQWKLIVLCLMLTGLATYFVSRFMTPVYQSTALVQVTLGSVNNRSVSSQADYNSLLASDQLVQTEASLAVSDPVLRGVAASFPGMTVEQLGKEVTSTPRVNTQLFEIKVQDSSPARAAALANATANTLIAQQQQATQQSNLQSQQQIQLDLKNTREQINTIATQIAVLAGQRGQQSQIAVLQAQLSGLQQHYSQWQDALAQLELTQAQSSNFLLIAQEARADLVPVRPNILFNTGAGSLAGLLLGILLAVAFVQLDTRMRSAEALSQLSGWPVLATIWRARSSKIKEVINPEGRDANVESYRILRTSIGFASVDKPLRSLMVTSAVPLEGKSVVAANLAIFMAKAGKNTLLIDADLRRPTVHRKLGLPADSMGLSNAVLAFGSPTVKLNTDRALAPFIHTVGIPNLMVMPSGPLPPNPSELLDSKAMQRLLEATQEQGIEVVIFDAPPLLGLSDASILASKVEGTLVVVDISRANRKNLKQVQTLLTQAGARVLGCVVNKQRRTSKDLSYSYYYQADNQKVEKSQGKKNKKASRAPEPMSTGSESL